MKFSIFAAISLLVWWNEVECNEIPFEKIECEMSAVFRGKTLLITSVTLIENQIFCEITPKPKVEIVVYTEFNLHSIPSHIFHSK